MKKDKFGFYRDKRPSVEIMKELSEDSRKKSERLMKRAREYLKRKDAKTESYKDD